MCSPMKIYAEMYVVYSRYTEYTHEILYIVYSHNP